MGLPIWRDPDEKKSSSRNGPKPDPTACLRSSIRRRPSIHGNRRGRRGPPLPRDPSVLPPRFTPSPPPSAGFNGLREQRRGDDRGVPPISNLLETADRQRTTRLPPPPPPPVPEPRSYWEATRGAPARIHAQAAERAQQERERNARLYEIRQRARREELYGWRERPGHDFEVIDLSEDEHRESEENRALRRSPTPPANRDDPTVPMHTIVLNPGEPLRILRSPEPMRSRRRPDSRDGSSARRSTLPTPPLDTSGPEDSLFIPESEADAPRPGLRRAHPLSHAWRPDSPVDGLGDRERSPESNNAWEIMQTTITPDESLPSAESSFASAAASHSFNASSNNTQMTDQDSRVNSGDDSDSGSEDDICNDVEMVNSEAVAEDMYHGEMGTLEGRERIARHQEIRRQEGNRFALVNEPPSVDIGFRLVEEALETPEGRERIMRYRSDARQGPQHWEEMLAASQRRNRSIRRSRRGAGDQTRREGSPDGPMDRYITRSRPEYGEEIRNVARETSDQVHDYFRRYTSSALADGPQSSRPRSIDLRSPPPEYEGPQQDENAMVSRDGPVSHPVSPPSQRSEREVSEALLSGDVQSSDVQDLDSMRRIVERLAARDDVPEDWWMSMGLNFSRARPQERRRPGTVVAGPDEPISRVRSGRVDRHERGNSRL
ncbi:hypothetical protein HII31_09892 [Pseudocercospora fuligena]|uniref:Uncharacterized protein n=1 Tax=Pseudocercospora fuligena TaxID=685502 RepID=A0A8H6VI75_9PEZI|nr:hypothetical protein HII31_09892 [Pseudocercospora fuligena]